MSILNMMVQAHGSQKSPILRLHQLKVGGHPETTAGTATHVQTPSKMEI